MKVPPRDLSLIHILTDALLAIDRDITAGKWQSRQKQDGREEEEISLYQLHPEVQMCIRDRDRWETLSIERQFYVSRCWDTTLAVLDF